MLSLDEHEQVSMRRLKPLLNRYFNSYADKVAPKLFKNSSNIPAKYKTKSGEKVAISYPTHIINAVLCGTAFYIYDRIVINKRDPDPTAVKLLMSSLTLHDVNKYMKNKYGIEINGNTKELIEKYFQSDDFDIKDFLSIDEFNVLFDEIIYLIQKTELWDKGQRDTIVFRSRYAELEDYARIGDIIASMSLEKRPERAIYDRFHSRDLHFVEIPQIPRQMLRRMLYKSLKTFIEENNGVPFLLSQKGIFYLSAHRIDLQTDKIKKIFLEKLGGNLDIQVDKLDFQSFQVESLSKLPATFEEKSQAMVEKVQDYFESGRFLGGTIKVTLPFDDDLKKLSVYIVYLVYQDGLERLIDRISESSLADKEKGEIIKNIENLKEMRKEITKELDPRDSNKHINTQVSKAYASHRFLKNITDYQKTLSKISVVLEYLIKEDLNKVSTEFIDKLIKSCTSDYMGENRAKFSTPSSKGDICFLCGQKSDMEYNEGVKGHFLQARGFSKRAEFGSEKKQICDICDIEKRLLEKVVLNSKYQGRNIRLADDMLFAYFYFDRIWPNISYFSEEFANTPFNVEAKRSGDTIIEFRLGDFSELVHIKPLPIKGKDNAAKQSSRVGATLHIFKILDKTGCKAVISKPYSLIRLYPDLFVNEAPSALELSLKVNKITDWEELEKMETFLDLIRRNDPIKGYYTVGDYNFLKLIHFLKRNAKDPNQPFWVKNNKDDVNKIFGDDIMKLKEIAKRGENLYLRYPKSTYKRTVIPRIAVDSILASMQQGLDEGQMKEIVCGQIYNKVQREKIAPKNGIEKNVGEFYDALVQYLKENNLYNIQKLSAWEKYLIDAYEFSFLTLKGRGDDINE
ncbi:MAG: hypothetical protein DDT42_01227 [candidate division WS2 bacterium]|uniref:Uncharacterized protein n=1 Tax=Psychracetigena formicireducens TaxID=2986056 RepID=A0A9E2BIR8_PSYF1|nr:hypothetical protein [Candidatus Psychracetigena formicireducens]